jgi:hypothetical protein
MIETSVMVHVLATQKEKHNSCQTPSFTQIVTMGKQRGVGERFLEGAARFSPAWCAVLAAEWIILGLKLGGVSLE